jgi:hypothetical protein
MHMKGNSFSIILVLGLLSGVAQAQRAHPAGFTGSSFEANKKFGLGLEIGDIAGLTGKLFISPNTALDFGIGDLYGGYYINSPSGGLHVYADFLWHPIVLVKADAFELPFYVGVGGRFWDFYWNCDRFGNCADHAQAFGIRVPLGVTFDFNNVPIDIFGQIVPTFDFFNRYGPRSFFLDVDFTVGIRYWFS